MLLPPDIISMATLGTDQSAFTLPPIDDGPLGGLLAQLDHASPELQLLIAVAALKLHAQAGWIPPRANRPLPEPCVLDETRPCGRRALRHLMVMLGGHYREALPEWLRELARQEKRIPEEALPMVLEAGRKNEHLRDLILPVIGQRGRWLALEATTRQWDWVEPRHSERTWERGSMEARADLLKWLRQRDPTRAREMLSESWQGEKADTRALFLQTFEYNLTMEDEPFLEAALDDRAERVRAVATHLLAGLPDSRFSERMRARAVPLLSLGRTRVRRKTVLEIKPCPGYDLSMRRDGIPEETGASELSEQFWWTQHVLRWVAPSFWCEQLQISLEELARFAQDSDAPFSLLSVLAEAAGYTGESDAHLLLLAADANLAAQFAPFRHLTHAQRERLAIGFLNTHRMGFQRGHPAAKVLKAIDQGWSRELSEAFVSSLRRYLQRERVRPDPDTRSMLLRFAQMISLDVKDSFSLTLDVETSAERVWGEMLDEIRLLLDFRREMLAAIHDDD